MRYIGLIIDPVCYAPVLQCMGMDVNEPLWYPYNTASVEALNKEYYEQ